MSVKAIAIPGALAQIGVATGLGFGLSWLLGWPLGAGLVFGLALSVASTVVLLRAMQERRLIETAQGRIAVGWLIVEDLAMVLALVILPPLAALLKAAESDQAPSQLELLNIAEAIGITLGKVAAFVVLMLVVGRRLIPLCLHYIAHTGSRELFRLAVLAIALGVAYGSAALFDVSFALGAFFAGMVLAESELSHRAAEESLPLRDAFAVLFFVSVGMLFDPAILLREPLPVLATVLIIVVGKSAAAYLIVRAFRHPPETALTISASLAQIGEFSFILAALGVSLTLLPTQARDLILAGAMLSILLNPLCFAMLDHLAARLRARMAPAVDAVPPPLEPPPVTALTDHAVLVGYGRVGRLVADGLIDGGVPLLLIEERQDLAAAARARGVEVILGNAASPDVLATAGLPAARWLFVAIPDAFEAGQIVSQASAANPEIDIVARAHSDAEVAHLSQFGTRRIIMGEREIARGMLEFAFRTGPDPAPA